VPYQERQLAEEFESDPDFDHVGGAAVEGGPRNRPTSLIVVVVLFALAAAAVAVLFAMVNR
jgi:hypothetical protein